MLWYLVLYYCQRGMQYAGTSKLSRYIEVQSSDRWHENEKELRLWNFFCGRRVIDFSVMMVGYGVDLMFYSDNNNVGIIISLRKYIAKAAKSQQVRGRTPPQTSTTPW